MADRHTIPAFLAPITARTFVSEYLDRAMLLIQRRDPDYFKQLISLSEIDRLVTSIRIPATNFNLAQDDLPLAQNAYCDGASYVNKERALNLHREGATIILRSVEQWSPALNRLRIETEKFFGCEAQTNAYLTPPSKKSTPPHWDTHDLVVLQITGRKRWRLYEGHRSLPLSDERFRIGEDYVSSTYKEVVLEPGDSLYLPRGIIHEPVADTYSVHVSIGIHPVRWYDVCCVALRMLAEQEGSPLRAALPCSHLAGSGRASLEALPNMLDRDLIEHAMEVVRSGFAEVGTVDLEGQLLEFARRQS
ncbi:cupin domain-containing protein [Paraherbaspirillum soli]|uniref:Cupin domain-containing protein n=1 Tax=Paraherbaspirillum soli TaxID=631222 RepID=A0ABW0M9M3_9BURK